MFPDLCYFSSSYSIEPLVKRTQFNSGNSRQRFHKAKRDDRFAVTLRLTTAELNTLNSFIIDDINNGADTFEGPYYTADIDYTGTLEIIDGTYSVNYLAKDLNEVSYQFDVKDRNMTNEQNIYETVNEYGGFDETSAAFDALEQMINFNNL